MEGELEHFKIIELQTTVDKNPALITNVEWFCESFIGGTHTQCVCAHVRIAGLCSIQIFLAVRAPMEATVSDEGDRECQDSAR